MRLVSGLYHYDGKIVISGSVIELYHYGKGVFKGSAYRDGRRGASGNSDRDKNREDALRRARRELRRIVNANFGQWGDDVTCKFVTLTFRDNVTDLNLANYEFKKFIKRLNYEVYGEKCSKLKYTVVVEFQERGAVHYHVIFYNLPYTKSSLIEDVWGNGFIKINRIDDIVNVGAYICKYLTKDSCDCRLRGRRSYFNSRGLKRSVEVYFDDEQLKSIKRSLPNEAMTYKAEFDNEYLGKIEYEQYNLSISRINDFRNLSISRINDFRNE